MPRLRPRPLLTLAGLLVLLVLPAHAVAARRVRLEDALADGDVDGEDVNARMAASLLGQGGVGRALVPAYAGGSAYVSLFGFVQTAAARGQEMGVGLVVGLPFDRPAARAGLHEGPGRPLPVRASIPAPVEELDVSRPSDAPLTPGLARASVAAALRVSGLGESDARMDSLASRARWSALLPEARVRAMRNEDERASLESTADASKLKDSAGAGLGLEARLTWRLDRLVFAEEETSLERLRLERHDARMRLAGKVLEALVRWSRATLEAREGDPVATTRLVEAEATLDVLTGGWFTASRTTRILVLPALPPEPEDARRRRKPVREGRGGAETAEGTLDEGAGERP